MTVREALDRAAELRPGCKLSDETRRRWLCEEDAMLRKLYFEKSGAAGYEKVGADAAWSGSTLPDSTELLVPVPYDTLYPHSSAPASTRRWGRPTATPENRRSTTAS